MGLRHRDWTVLAVLWAGVGLIWATSTRRIRFSRLEGDRNWHRPWLHWCLFDRECQEWGNPKRVYVLALGFYIQFGKPEVFDAGEEAELRAFLDEQ